MNHKPQDLGEYTVQKCKVSLRTIVFIFILNTTYKTDKVIMHKIVSSESPESHDPDFCMLMQQRRVLPAFLHVCFLLVLFFFQTYQKPPGWCSYDAKLTYKTGIDML